MEERNWSQRFDEAKRRLNDALKRAGGNLHDPEVQAAAAELDSLFAFWIRTRQVPPEPNGHPSSGRPL